jgi:hypothetical protein
MIRDGPPINVVELLSVAKLVKQIDARANQQRRGPIHEPTAGPARPIRWPPRGLRKAPREGPDDTGYRKYVTAIGRRIGDGGYQRPAESISCAVRGSRIGLECSCV